MPDNDNPDTAGREPRPAARIDTALLNAIWHTLSVPLAEAKAAVPLIRDHLARDGYTIAQTAPGRVEIPLSTLREIHRAIECSTVLAAPRLLGIVDAAIAAAESAEASGEPST